MSTIIFDIVEVCKLNKNWTLAQNEGEKEEKRNC